MNTKRFAALLVAVILAFSLCACSNNDGSSDTGATTHNTAASSSAEQDAPVTEPVVPENPVVSITSKSIMSNDESYTTTLVLTACYADGTEAWKYTSPKCCLGQFDPVDLITAANNTVYLFEQGVYVEGGEPEDHGLIALDMQTGAIKWRNTDFYGAWPSFALSDDGTIYVGGYDGPDCVAIDKDGRTLWKYQNDLDCYWLYDIKLDVDHLALYFEESDAGGGRTIYIDLDGTYLG